MAFEDFDFGFEDEPAKKGGKPSGEKLVINGYDFGETEPSKKSESETPISDTFFGRMGKEISSEWDSLSPEASEERSMPRNLLRSLAAAGNIIGSPLTAGMGELGEAFPEAMGAVGGAVGQGMEALSSGTGIPQDVISDTLSATPVVGGAFRALNKVKPKIVNKHTGPAIEKPSVRQTQMDGIWKKYANKDDMLDSQVNKYDFDITEGGKRLYDDLGEVKVVGKKLSENMSPRQINQWLKGAESKFQKQLDNAIAKKANAPALRIDEISNGYKNIKPGTVKGGQKALDESGKKFNQLVKDTMSEVGRGPDGILELRRRIDSQFGDAKPGSADFAIRQLARENLNQALYKRVPDAKRPMEKLSSIYTLRDNVKSKAKGQAETATGRIMERLRTHMPETALGAAATAGSAAMSPAIASGALTAYLGYQGMKQFKRSPAYADLMRGFDKAMDNAVGRGAKASLQKDKARFMHALEEYYASQGGQDE